MRILRAVLNFRVGKVGVERTGQWLAPSNEGSTSPSAVPVIFLVFLVLFGVVLDISLYDLFDVANLDQDVLGLQVGMDDPAFPVHIIQTQQDLFCDLLDQRHGDAAMVPALNQTQEIFTQHLEDHADVDTIGTFVLEGIEQTDDMFPTRVGRVGFDDAAQQFNLIDGGFGVMGGGAHDLEGNVLVGNGIAGQPDSGKVTPAQLANDDITTIVVGLPDGDGMIATLDIILGILLFGGGLDFVFFG